LDALLPSIRRATAEDAEEVTRLRVEFLREVGEAEGRSYPPEIKTTTRDYVVRTLKTGALCCWLAEEGGRTVGCCALILFDRPPSYGNLSGLAAYLLNVYTVPAHRRRGIAARLIEEALRHARQIGAGRVFLHTSVAGRALYEKLGFRAKENEMDLTF
jgi:ribosomal protein S18 acetylase RimI-like enzyme